MKKIICVLALLFAASAADAQVVTLDTPVVGVLEKDFAVWSDSSLTRKITRTSAATNDTVKIVGYWALIFQVVAPKYAGFVTFPALLDGTPEVSELKKIVRRDAPEMKKQEAAALEKKANDGAKKRN